MTNNASADVAFKGAHCNRTVEKNQAWHCVASVEINQEMNN